MSILDHGLSIPGKINARVLIEKVKAFEKSFELPYSDFHYDKVNLKKPTVLAIRSLQTLAGITGTYLSDKFVDQKLAVEYRTKREELKEQLVRPILYIRSQEAREQALTECNLKLVDYDMNSTFFKSFDSSQVDYLELGEALFFRANQQTDFPNSTKLPALGHFVPIAPARLRVIYDFLD